MNKARIVDAVIGCYGSGTVVVDTLVNGHTGFAASIMTLGNEKYSTTVADMFPSSKFCSTHWDGGSYGGLSVNIGSIGDAVSGNGAYMEPRSHPSLFTGSVSEGAAPTPGRS